MIGSLCLALLVRACTCTFTSIYGAQRTRRSVPTVRVAKITKFPVKVSTYQHKTYIAHKNYTNILPQFVMQKYILCLVFTREISSCGKLSFKIVIFSPNNPFKPVINYHKSVNILILNINSS